MADKKQKIITGIIVLILAVSIVLVAMLLRGKTSLETPTTNTTIGMGTVVVESFYCKDSGVSDQAIKKATEIINDLDRNKLSWREKTSEIYALNNAGSGTLSKVTYDCLSTCIDISKNCGGALDVTVGPLSGLWNIGTNEARVPSDAEIDEALPRINFERISLDSTSDKFAVSIGDDQRLDLGAVGKGLACDVIRDYVKSTTIVGGTVSVGGSILVYGENSTSKDKTWNVGVRNPFGNDSDYMAVINCSPCCISTSGDYEKVLEINGKKYHHILNPKTGYPAESQITGVTIVADSGIVTDALSTACFILGYSDESLALLEKYNANAIFVMKDKTVYITDGIKSHVTIVDDSFKLGSEVAA